MGMTFKYKVPEYARQEARKGLKLRKQLKGSKKFGLSPSEAKKLGITSGVSRAYKLINSKYITIRDIKSIARFYLRFKGCRTQKCEGALLLWGGRRFGKRMVEVWKMVK